MNSLLFFVLIQFCAIFGRIPREYEEIDENENLLFTILEPYHLAYTYQMKPSYMLGSQFHRPPNSSFKNIQLVLAEPITACYPLLNQIDGQTALLIERGGCSFTEKVNHAQDIGAVLAMVTDSEWTSNRDYVHMMPDSSLRIVDIPCVSISPRTGQHLKDFLISGDAGKVKMNIPVEKITSPWIHHQRKAPWEYWGDDGWIL